MAHLEKYSQLSTRHIFETRFEGEDKNGDYINLGMKKSTLIELHLVTICTNEKTGFLIINFVKNRQWNSSLRTVRSVRI